MSDPTVVDPGLAIGALGSSLADAAPANAPYSFTASAGVPQERAEPRTHAKISCCGRCRAATVRPGGLFGLAMTTIRR